MCSIFEFVGFVKDTEHLAIRRRCVYYLLIHIDLLLLQKQTDVTNEEIPMVNIVQLLQNTSSTHVDHLEPNLHSPFVHLECETPKKSSVTTFCDDAIASLFTHSHEEHFIPCSKIDYTLSMLLAPNVAFSLSQNMEEIPTQNIILEDFCPFKNEQPIDLYALVSHNHQKFHTE